MSQSRLMTPVETASYWTSIRDKYLADLAGKSSASARDNAPPTGSITPDDNARTTGSTSPGESALSTADVSKPVSTAENLLTHRAEYTNADGDLIYWGYVLELGAQKQMAVVTLWIDDSYGPSVGCSTKGYDGLDPLELGDWVQIRLVMYGEHGGETFVQHALKPHFPIETLP